MSRSMVRMLSTALLLVVAGPRIGTAAEPAYSVVVDDDFHRPLLRRTPPVDKNGDTPLEVVEGFLDEMNVADFAAAAKRCNYGWRKGNGDPDPTNWRTTEGELFAEFGRQVRQNVKEVTLSGSTIHDKGYWHIRYKIKDAAGREELGTLHLLQVDEVWKICEKSYWADMADGKEPGARW